MQLQSLLETVCAFFSISEHTAAVIHQTGLLTRIPGMDFRMEQKGVNHFLAIFIGQCIPILLLWQLKDSLPAQNGKYISRWITYFKTNQ